jgi:hypothetical protein
MYDQQAKHLPLLFLPINGRLKDLLPLQIVSHRGKVKIFVWVVRNVFLWPEPGTFGGLSREDRDEWDLCSCRMITASSLSYNDSIYVAYYCTNRNAESKHPSRTIHHTECGIVVTCHIRLLPYLANRVKEPVVSSYDIVLPSNTALSDVETLRCSSLLYSPDSRT